MTSRSKSALSARLLALCLGTAAITPACALFASGPSMVAQGKYFSSGNPQYDEFFIQLYQAQLLMAEAPAIPDSERQGLAQTLGLSPDTPIEGVTQQLHEAALKLSRTGTRMKLEQHASLDKPEAASATIVASNRPKDNPAAILIAKVESAATNLRRAASQMLSAEAQLGKLEVNVVTLDAEAPRAFAEARVGTQTEVKKNLADAQKLIVLMKARGTEVNAQCEALLANIAKAVDTDDGSLSAAPEAETQKPAVTETKRAAPRPHAKSQSAATPASHAAKPTPAKPAAAKSAASDDEASTKAAAPNKPAPPPRDFEP